MLKKPVSILYIGIPGTKRGKRENIWNFNVEGVLHTEFRRQQAERINTRATSRRRLQTCIKYAAVTRCRRCSFLFCKNNWTRPLACRFLWTIVDSVVSRGCTRYSFEGKVHILTSQLSRLSDFQPQTVKPDILHHWTVKTGQDTP